FQGASDGANPYDGVVLDAAGNLYGTTKYGGYPCIPGVGCGTVFKLDTTGTKTVLYAFRGQPLDGNYPQARLLRDAAGNLYGTTIYGGSSRCFDLGCGTVFKVDTSGNETVLYEFTGRPGGRYPSANLIRDAAGNLYGTTVLGGASECNPPYGCGTVFRLDTTGGEVVLHRFTGGADGAKPFAGLVRDATGNLYGTTGYGGVRDKGTVF